MSRRVQRYGSIGILLFMFLFGLFSLGCVAVLTIGESHKIQVSDNDGATSIVPKRGLLK